MTSFCYKNSEFDNKGLSTCHDCKLPPKPGRSRCFVHAAKDNRSNARVRYIRRARGFCKDCNEPAAVSKSRCRSCSGKNVETTKRYRINNPGMALPYQYPGDLMKWFEVHSKVIVDLGSI